jgi:hypothetical protein
VAYAGAFTAEYRREFEAEWTKELDDQHILHSENLTMRETLGDNVLMQ